MPIFPTNYTIASTNSTNYSSTSVNSTNYAVTTLSSTNYESDDLAGDDFLLQSGSFLLLQNGDNFLKQ